MMGIAHHGYANLAANLRAPRNAVGIARHRDVDIVNAFARDRILDHGDGVALGHVVGSIYVDVHGRRADPLVGAATSIVGLWGGVIMQVAKGWMVK